tara:strand:- start:541 stop:1410 length:870 start_codon:yes stop_codon:yes gene_type:complete
MGKIKYFIKEFIPPIFIRCLKGKKTYKYGWIGCFFNIRKYGYIGFYNSWKDAKNKTSGYGTANIIEKVKKVTIDVIDGDLYELDNILYDGMFNYPYNWQILSTFLLISQNNNNSLNILDFGGSLGTTFLQHRRYITHLDSVKYSIVEQENFVRTGKKIFNDKDIYFYSSIDLCIQQQNPQCILFSGVLQYLEFPYEILNNVINCDFQYIIIDRTPFFVSSKIAEKISIQRIEEDIYGASFPHRIFNYNNFVNIFKDDYTILAESLSIDAKEKARGIPIHKRFILLKRKS